MTVIKFPAREQVDKGLDRIDKLLKLLKKDQRAQLLKKKAEKKAVLGVLPD